MGTFSGTLQARSTTTTPTAADIANIYNTITAAMLGCGMLRVDAAVYPGQAGTFVTSAPGADQTLVAVPTATNVAPGRLDGVNLFKHPNAELYVLVYYRWGYSPGGSWQHLVLGMEFATAISAGALVAGKTSGELFPLSAPLFGATTAVLPASPFPLIASCGVDHFWIHHVGSLVQPTATADSARPYRSDRPPLIGIGVFQSDVDPTTFIMVSPLPYTGATSTATAVTDSFTTAGLRAWRVLAFNKGVFETHQNGSAGYVIDPGTPSGGDGVRVVRATKYVGGKLHAFNFAYMVRAVVTENTDYQLNVLGTGAKTYRSCLGMGPCSPVYWQPTTTEYSVPLFPWNV